VQTLPSAWTVGETVATLSRARQREFLLADRAVAVSRRAAGPSAVSAGSKSNAASAGIQHPSSSEFVLRKDVDYGSK
jgi:hypothetical protein